MQFNFQSHTQTNNNEGEKGAGSGGGWGGFKNKKSAYYPRFKSKNLIPEINLFSPFLSNLSRRADYRTKSAPPEANFKI